MAEEPLQPILPEEEEEGGPVKTFLEHLEDLRWVIIRCVATLLLAMVGCLVATPHLVKIMTYPLDISGITTKVVPLSPIGGIMISLKMAFFGGISVALPFMGYFVSDYILPALKRNEKGYFVRALTIGCGLFMLGVLLAFFYVLPISLKGLDAYNSWMGLGTDVWRAEDYFHLIVMVMLGMGVSMEIPVVILTLVRMGVISHETLVKSRAYFLVGNMVLCAMITPDAISTLFMVLPVQVLMEICILISKHWERKKRIAEAELAALEAPKD
jgi:sec-independent protein translocase protein TatC